MPPKPRPDPLAPWRITLPRPGAADTYSFPDPDGLVDAYQRVRDGVYYKADAGPDPEDLKRVLSLAEGYLELTTYELGPAHCGRKLQDIWRARKRRGSA